MCGRFTITISYEELLDYLDETFDIKTTHIEPSDVKRYNVAPTQNVIAIIHDGQKYRAGTLKWGLIPSFAKDEKSAFQMINAKAETIDEKVSFKNLIQSKRCLIVADSFYEWKRVKNEKQPLRFLLKNHKPFTMAGLWTTYQRPDGHKVHTCTIITTQANALVSKIHERMPVIIPNEHQSLWLDHTIQYDQNLAKLLVPYDESKMESYEVKKDVNLATYEDPSCILPLKI
jgi:putative SOS response-associated peptidase YedK